MDFDPADRPPPDSGFKWCCVVFCCMMLYDVVMFLKGMVIQSHTPTTCRNSKILGVMFPFGAIGAWSKAQRAEWQHSALHVVDTVVTPISAASFHVFQRNNFCSAPFRLSFSCWMSFTTRGPILTPTKTENEFPSRGKPQIPGKTSHANNPTQRSQQEQKVSR